jgi:DNA-binding MarR family transcriptional regulator
MATRIVARHYDRALAPFALTTNAFSLLSRLEREGPQTIGSLAAGLAIDRTTLSRELAPLVERRLVDARPGDRDRRQRVVEVSEEGAALVKRARPVWAKAQEDLAGMFGRERTDGLLAELHAFIGAAA